MADPHYELREALTAINYAVDAHELEVLLALMNPEGGTGLSTPAAVLDLALWKLAEWYGIPVNPDAFDLGRRNQRDKQRLRGGEL